MTEMYDNPQHLKDTFTESNLSEYLLQAQWAEFVELKKAIADEDENAMADILSRNGLPSFAVMMAEEALYLKYEMETLHLIEKYFCSFFVFHYSLQSTH